MEVAVGQIDGRADDLATRIDIFRKKGNQGRAGRNDLTQVGHPAIVPEDRTQVPARIDRDADHIAHVVDAESHASDVAGKRILPFSQRNAKSFGKKNPCQTWELGKRVIDYCSSIS